MYATWSPKDELSSSASESRRPPGSGDLGYTPAAGRPYTTSAFGSLDSLEAWKAAAARPPPEVQAAPPRVVPQEEIRRSGYVPQQSPSLPKTSPSLTLPPTAPSVTLPAPPPSRKIAPASQPIIAVARELNPPPPSQNVVMTRDIQPTPGPKDPQLEEQRAMWSQLMEEFFAQKMKGIQDDIGKSREEAMLMINRVASQCQDQFRQLSSDRIENHADFENLRSTVDRLQSQVAELSGKHHDRALHGESITDMLAIHRHDIDTLMGEKKQAHLQVKIIAAANLPSKDSFGGKSDPYCVVEVVGKPHNKLQTPVIYNSDNPVWEYAGELVEFADGDALEVSVFDKDNFKWDDLIGKVIVPNTVFAPNGFSGNIEIDNSGATVHLELVPVEVGAAPGPAGAAVTARAALTKAQVTQEEVDALKRHTETLNTKLMKAEQIYKDTMMEVQTAQRHVPKERDVMGRGIGHQDITYLEAKTKSLETDMANLQTYAKEIGDNSQKSIKEVRDALSQKIVSVSNQDRKARIDLAMEVEKKCRVYLPQAHEADENSGSVGSFFHSVGRLFSWE